MLTPSLDQSRPCFLGSATLPSTSTDPCSFSLSHPPTSGTEHKPTGKNTKKTNKKNKQTNKQTDEKYEMNHTLMLVLSPPPPSPFPIPRTSRFPKQNNNNNNIGIFSFFFFSLCLPLFLLHHSEKQPLNTNTKPCFRLHALSPLLSLSPIYPKFLLPLFLVGVPAAYLPLPCPPPPTPPLSATFPCPHVPSLSSHAPVAPVIEIMTNIRPISTDADTAPSTTPLPPLYRPHTLGSS